MILRVFKHHQRVKIVNHGSYPELNGRTGVVMRVCTNGAAWVEVKGLERKYASFPAGDSRATHIKLYPDECEGTHE